MKSPDTDVFVIGVSKAKEIDATLLLHKKAKVIDFLYLLHHYMNMIHVSKEGDKIWLSMVLKKKSL